MSPNRKKHNAAHADPAKHWAWDKDYGSVTPHPWRVRNSGGAQVMQIVTEPRLSRLEQRSLNKDKDGGSATDPTAG